MRYSIILWIFYLGLITALPCSDTQTLCASTGMSTKLQTSFAQQQAADDACAPFCLCSCCSISISSLGFEPVTLTCRTILLPAQKIAKPIKMFGLNVYGNIWQPPKIVA